MYNYIYIYASGFIPIRILSKTKEKGYKRSRKKAIEETAITKRRNLIRRIVFSLSFSFPLLLPFVSSAFPYGVVLNMET